MSEQAEVTLGRGGMPSGLGNRLLRHLWGLLGPFIGLLVVIGFFALIAGDARGAFLSLFNFKTVLTQVVIVALGALGMTLVIVSGGIDLSVGSTVAFCSVVVAWVLLQVPSPALAMVAGVAVGTLIGFINGSLITGLRMVPFIVTLGMLGMARGGAKWLAKSQKINGPIDCWLYEFMVKEPDGWGGVAPGVWMVLVLAIVVALLLTRTVFGRHVVAIGSNEATARLCGVRVLRVKVLIYTICGFFTGLAGTMQFARLTVGDPTVAVGLELDIIAAVVIGGGSLSGGVGSILGSLIGALIMAFLRNGCQQVGWPNYLQEIIIGAIIVVAVAVDQFRQRRGEVA
ncbi:MAG: ABC transporter permease [Verrucomicrobiota bacterium]|nr:ABC transporter permease [Verrucomicrobiota bacterium]MDD8045020.1 ABC transporter permease [Verrucomicrobiota bacterium]MDD8050143.1 ABC transporter permease [Verrucomicrobiota bacterium]MDI9384418.1 ABC transporter permease [Verrucomicrobiota bacterium]